MTKIKICGITNLDDALLAVRCGADQLGFNFYVKSPRCVTPEISRSINVNLPANILKVGVFVNASVENIIEAAKVALLDAIQLHGDETSVFAEDVGLRTGLTVIRALRVTPEFEVQDAVENGADAVLLDGYSPIERGGTGDTFDWEIAHQVSTLVPVLYLAGGLTPENVGEAIRKVRPYAVDVCSRIESGPGKKDEDKLRRFIAAVRETV